MTHHNVSVPVDTTRQEQLNAISLALWIRKHETNPGPSWLLPDERKALGIKRHHWWNRRSQ